MSEKNYIIEADTLLVNDVWEYRQSLNHPDLYTRAEAERRVTEQRKKFTTKRGNVHYRIVRALPQSTDPIAILESARKYLGDEAYAGARGSMSYSRWYDAISDARGILYVALTDIEAEREPEVPLTVVFVDLVAIENRVLRNSILDGDVQKLLPFQTKQGRGNNHVHIVNASAYEVNTSTHTIYEGDTICARSGRALDFSGYAVGPTCPGCIEKGKGIIIEHLRNTEAL